MMVEVDTDLTGVCELMLAGARINVRDASRDESLLRELYWRCEDPRRIRYQRERRDRWTTIAVLRSRHRRDEPWLVDCEDEAMLWGAYLLLRAPHRPVWLAACQPREDGIAHAFNRVGADRRVWDGCVWNGMQAIPPDYYDRGQTAAVPLTVE